MVVASDYLEVAIGLVFVFLMLSLLASWLQELIAMLLSWRSKDLVDILQVMLDPSVEKGEGHKKLKAFKEKFGEVVDLEETKKELEKKLEELEKRLEGMTDPKEIEEVEKLISDKREEIKSITAAVTDPLLNFYHHGIVKGLAKPGERPSYIPAQQFTTALIDILLKAGGAEDTQLEIALENINKGIETLDEANPAKKSLQAIMRNAAAAAEAGENKVAAVRKGIEGWFDATMQRTSGWYKRSKFWWALGIGLVLAVAANADTISITKVLLEDRAVRDAVIGQASVYAERTETQEEADEAKEILKQLGVPLGWTKVERARLRLPAKMTPDEISEMGELPDPVGAWISKVLGLLITGFSISQGSSVWFDLLGRLVNMRGTGTKPKEATASVG
jgi:hypothetical protein